MRVTMPPLGATGAGPWLPIDTEQTAFGVGYVVTVQDGSTLTFKTQHGWSTPQDECACKITRTTTTATLVAQNPLTAQVGDSIVVRGSGSSTFDGTFAVATVTNANTITYTVANSGPTTTAGMGVFVRIIHVVDDPIVTGKTGTTEGNLAFPCSHLRLNLTAWSAGAAAMTVFQPSGN